AALERGKPGQGRRKLDTRVVYWPFRLVPQHDGQAQPAVCEVRERVPRCAGERLGSEERRHFVLEETVERLPLTGRQIAPRSDGESCGRRRVRHRLERAVVSRDQRMDRDRDRIELLGRGEAVRRAFGVGPPSRGYLVLQRADLDHEELVEIRADDREEPESGRERRALV